MTWLRARLPLPFLLARPIRGVGLTARLTNPHRVINPQGPTQSGHDMVVRATVVRAMVVRATVVRATVVRAVP